MFNREKCLRVFEVSILTPVVLIIIGFSCIPTVFYGITSQEDEILKMDSNCSEVQIYSGEVCRDVFVSLQMCFSGVTSPPPALNIPSLIDQQTDEKNAMNLLNGLSFLSPSQECRVAIVPFLCLNIFELCDSSNQLHTILREDCLFLRDGICANEWRQAVEFLGAGVLPVCEDLPPISDDCIAHPNITYLDNETALIASNNTPSPNKLVCSEGFFFDENGTSLCRPICGEFFPKHLAAQVVEIIAACVGVVASVAVIILAVTVQRGSLLKFPSVIFIYICITEFVYAAIIIVSSVDNTALLCGSKDLIDAIQKGNETVFCTIFGIVSIYSLDQLCIWMAIFAVFLFWGAAFPFSYRQLKISGRIRYAHITSVLLAVVVPLLAALLNLKDGYILTLDSPHICVGRNRDYIYYTILLPISVSLAIAKCLLALVFWVILKKFVLKKLLMKAKVVRGGFKGELKIAIIIIYTAILALVAMVGYIYADTNDDFQEDLETYIFCESTGISPDCVLDKTVSDIFQNTFTTSYVMLAFIPMVALLINCNLKHCKEKFKKRKKQAERVV